MELLDKLPQFAKTVKTRNHNVSKLSLRILRDLDNYINIHPVRCDEFDFFQYQFEENLEFISKISMMLEDERS